MHESAWGELRRPRRFLVALTTACLTVALGPVGHAATVSPGLPIRDGVATTSEVPTAPRGVSATASAKNQLRVAWSEPANLNGSLIAYYVVVLRTTTLPVQQEESYETRDGSARELVIDDLRAGEPYNVTVYALSTHGDGASSSPVLGIPYSDPSFSESHVVRAIDDPTTSDPSDVHIMWDAANGNGASILEYDVFVDGALEPIASVDGSVTRTTVSGMPTGRYLIFRIQAVSAVGLSAMSRPSEALILASRPSAPRHVFAIPGDQTVTLTWLAPEHQGGSPISGYVITGGGRQWSVSGHQTSTTLTGLTNGVEYVFAVAAQNATGSSESSVSNFVTPMSSPHPPGVQPPVTPMPPSPPPPALSPPAPQLVIPYKPRQVKIRVVGSRVVVRWTQGHNASNAPRRFRFQLWKPSGKKQVLTVHATGTNKPKYTLKRLPIGRNMMSVSAGNKAGWSASSRRLHFIVRR